ncbi:MAG: protein kinase [Deltaproteobacteria bacterium]|nr:protein kinase [Deltaproteobacteria bacterium]
MVRVGDLLADRFELIQVAGLGMTGRVFRARDRHTGANVAVKILSRGRARDVERFAREGRLLAELSHPSIVRYVAHGVTITGSHYLAMEWLEGGDLADYLARVRMTIDGALGLCLRAAQGLAVAHARGVVHRDIKPSNLFLVGGSPERVKILDFGTARVRKGVATTTRTGVRLGTPSFMAPEQVRGERRVDARADVFSLGCVLFWCLTGFPAFAGKNDMAVLAKILLEEPPRVRELSGEVPWTLDELVGRMLSKEPDDRPRDGAEVADAITAILAGRDPSGRGDRTLTKIADGEQRLLSVIMAGGTSARARVVQIVSKHGAHLERLPDGVLVITLTSGGSATDLVGQAARCALSIRALLGHAPIALGTGRGVVRGRFPVGEVIDRVSHAWHGIAQGMPGIACDELTAGLLREKFVVRRGVEGFELLRETEPQETAPTLLGKASPFVGRDRELSVLSSVLEECIAEPVARAVLVTAPAGLGKSRLAHEFFRSLASRTDSVEAWFGCGDPVSAGSPFGLTASVLRQACGMTGGEPLESRKEKLRARIGRYLGEGERVRVTEFLGEVVGISLPVQSAEYRAARKEPMLMGDQILRAWLDWLSAECAAHPLLILVDDLHWADLPSIKLLDAAQRSLRDHPFMVLALARPEVDERFPKLWEGRAVTVMQLHQLTRKASGRLIVEILKDRAGEELIAEMAQRSAGNPLYLEELIRAEAEGKGNELPDTVLAMVQARLERLPAEARRLLRAASVFGTIFPRGGVHALLGGECAGEWDDWLSELLDREVIHRCVDAKFPGETDYAFRHPLFRDAAQAMLTTADRLAAHRLAAEYLEKMGEGEAIVVAEHLEQGALPGRAVAWYLRAAEQALEGNDFAQVITRAQRGIQCGAEGELLGALMLLQAEAHKWRGETEDAERSSLEAVSWLGRGSARWCSAVGELATASSRLGNRHRLALLGDLLVGVAQAEALSPPEQVACARTAQALLLLGLHENADRLYESLAHAPADDMEPVHAAPILSSKAVRAAQRGEPVEFLRLLERAISKFEEAGNLRGTLGPRVNVGFGYMEVGAYERAASVLRDAAAVAERFGVFHQHAAKQNLGLALARLGRLDEAIRVQEEALAQLEAQGDKRLMGLSRIYLSISLLLANRPREAEAAARDAESSLVSAPPVRAHALSQLAATLLAQGRKEEARAAAQEAHGILESLGSVPEGESLVRLMHAETLLSIGAGAEEQSAILAARDRLLERAKRIHDPELRASFCMNVPENARTLELAEEVRK